MAVIAAVSMGVLMLSAAVMVALRGVAVVLSVMLGMVFVSSVSLATARP